MSKRKLTDKEILEQYRFLNADKYDLIIDEDDDETGIIEYALTAKPAVIIKGVAFNDHIKKHSFRDAEVHPNCRCTISGGTFFSEPDCCELCDKARDEYNRNSEFEDIFGEMKYNKFAAIKEAKVIIAPLMRADQWIYRNDEEDGEHYTRITKENAYIFMNKMMKNSKTNYSINLDHTQEKVNGFTQQIWIVEDPKIDKSALYGFEEPIGTVMACVKIEDDKFWKEMVKDKEYTGLSIEGYFGMKKVKHKLVEKKDTKETFESILSDYNKEVKSIYDEYIKKNKK